MLNIGLLLLVITFASSFTTVQKSLSTRGELSLHAAKKKKDAITSSPTPERVVADSNVPIRQQIAWAKAKKRLASSVSGGIGQKFRREKASKQVQADDDDHDYMDYSNVQPPVIFVDGYNIIGYMKSAEKKDFDNLDTARDSLINDLAVLRSATGWLIEVVFDAYKREGGTQQSHSENNVIVTYTSKSETADTHIERRFESLRKRGFANMIVCTDDNLLRMVGGSSGSGYLSAANLVDEINIAYKGWESMEVELADEQRTATVRDALSHETSAAISLMKAEQARANAAATAAKKEAEKAMRKQLSALNGNGVNGVKSTQRLSQKERKKRDQEAQQAASATARFQNVTSLRPATVEMGMSAEMRKVMDMMRQAEAETEKDGETDGDGETEKHRGS